MPSMLKTNNIPECCTGSFNKTWDADIVRLSRGSRFILIIMYFSLIHIYMAKDCNKVID